MKAQAKKPGAGGSKTSGSSSKTFGKYLRHEEKKRFNSINKKKSMDKQDRYAVRTLDTSVYLNGNMLIVGDGDLTFASSLLKIRGVGYPNIIATTYDSLDVVKTKYPNTIQKSLDALKKRSVPVFHNVDATNLSNSFPKLLPTLTKHKPAAENTIASKIGVPPSSHNNYPFDRIVFNYPHSGEQRVHVNRDLLKNFFLSSRAHLTSPKMHDKGYMIPGTGGKVYVTLKSGMPYNSWDIEEQAAHALYNLEDKVLFDASKFRDYKHQTTNPEHNTIDEKSDAYLYIFTPSALGYAVAAQEAKALIPELTADDIKKQKFAEHQRQMALAKNKKNIKEKQPQKNFTERLDVLSKDLIEEAEDDTTIEEKRERRKKERKFKKMNKNEEDGSLKNLGDFISDFLSNVDLDTNNDVPMEGKDSTPVVDTVTTVSTVEPTSVVPRAKESTTTLVPTKRSSETQGDNSNQPRKNAKNKKKQ